MRHGEETSRRRLWERWRLVSPTGAEVISLRQLPLRERLRVTAPSLFTTLNMFCGLSSVLLAFRNHFTTAAVLVGIAVVLDIADGAVARLIGATSPFGLQLDSLADLVSFGLAPAVLVHTWALNQWPVLAWVAAFFWMACSAFRLARFNVTIDPLADKRYFIGLPSPGAAGVVIATVFALEQPSETSAVLAPLVIGVLPALLMVTSVRFRSFRDLVSLRSSKWRLRGLVIGLIVIALVFDTGIAGQCLAYGYVLTAPLGWLTKRLRARWFGSDQVAPTRHRMPSVFLSSTDSSDSTGSPDESADDSPVPAS